MRLAPCLQMLTTADRLPAETEDTMQDAAVPHLGSGPGSGA